MSMAGLEAFAHDFEVTNNGATLYYNYNDGSTGSSVSVTFHGSGTTHVYNIMHYSGTIVIPSEVTYNGKTYNVTKIGKHAFSNGQHITSITIPDGVTSIDEEAFEACTSLTSITIPDGVTIIGSEAFMNCSKLKTITIPNSVTSIGYQAFYFCESVTKIKCMAVTPPRCDIRTFGSIDYTTCRLQVPKESIEAYRNAEYWKKFTIVEDLSADKGDINGDATISMADANLVVNYYLATNKPSDFNIDAADINGDGIITMADANLIVNTFLNEGK